MVRRRESSFLCMHEEFRIIDAFNDSTHDGRCHTNWAERIAWIRQLGSIDMPFSFGLRVSYWAQKNRFEAELKKWKVNLREKMGKVVNNLWQNAESRCRGEGARVIMLVSFDNIWVLWTLLLSNAARWSSISPKNHQFNALQIFECQWQ